MIIDIHTHVGRTSDFNLPKKVLLDSINRYSIDFVLISNIAGSEVDQKQRIYDEQQQIDQVWLNEKTIEFASLHADKMKVLLWCKPLTQGYTPAFEKLYKKHRKMICGLKIHPYYSKMKMNDRRMEGYIQMAEMHKLPILVHTAQDEYSDPQAVYEMALKYPKVKFILGHMELGSGHERVVELMKKAPNLYADTAWVNAHDIYYIIQEIGSDRIMFGTDNPVNGVDTYNDGMIQTYFKELKEHLNEDDYANLMYKNAIRIFGLKELEELL